MAALLLALVLALLIEQGSATQSRIAIAGPDGWPMIGLATATTTIAALTGGALAPILTAEARLLFLALALGFASLGLLVSVMKAPPPGHAIRAGSGAMARFLLGRAGENLLFVLCAVGTFTGAPPLAAIGGAIGSFAALSAAAMAGPRILTTAPHRALRATTGVLLLLAAMFTAAHALRLIA